MNSKNKCTFTDENPFSDYIPFSFLDTSNFIFLCRSNNQKKVIYKNVLNTTMAVPWQNYLYAVGLYLLYVVIIVAPVKMILRKKTALSEKKIEIIDYSMSGFGLGFCLSFFLVNLPIYYALGWAGLAGLIAPVTGWIGEKVASLFFPRHKKESLPP